MNDAVGSVWPLAFVSVAIVFFSGFLAFSVNYNKAYKMKDQVIYILEKNDNNYSNSKAEIKEYADKIGYRASSRYLNRCRYEVDSEVGICYHEVTSGTAMHGKEEQTTTYVEITTWASLDIPLFAYFFSGIPIFSIDGSTKKIVKIK